MSDEGRSALSKSDGLGWMLLIMAGTFMCGVVVTTWWWNGVNNRHTEALPMGQQMNLVPVDEPYTVTMTDKRGMYIDIICKKGNECSNGVEKILIDKSRNIPIVDFDFKKDQAVNVALDSFDHNTHDGYDGP